MAELLAGKISLSEETGEVVVGSGESEGKEGG